MNEPYRLRYVNQIVGVFLIVVFILSIVISVRFTSGLAVKKDLFYIHVPEDMAAQLRTGTEVIILGETVGQVDALDYVVDDDLVRVTLAINSKQSDQITTESEVTLDRKYGVGPAVVRIRRNRPEGQTDPPKRLLPGQTITRIQEQDDQVDRMAGEIEAAGNSIDNAARQLQKSLGESIDPAFRTTEETFESLRLTSDAIRPEAVQTLAQLRETTENLESELTRLARRVDQLVDGDIRTTIQRIQDSATAATDAAESVETLAANIDAKSDKANADVATTLATLRETARLIQRLTNETREIVTIVRGEAEELPGTTQRVNDTVEDTQELVGDIQDHWLLRRYRERKSPTQQLSPSAVRGGGVR
ncbi:hypothetical protein Mal15_42760 [Stieleria maiorica]|uniref:Mce/MlaD domain-containing protein n=1 Tax=Stieleria maiorica TaxID=2795974 RepID=A0A5B9MKW5_9BACT|nr:MlaD family protein [Stieleria maiorica]QEG00206.1 hypothetical protein Mal15_42760 [Stieleria maiorica]